jgi:hypothetical protein
MEAGLARLARQPGKRDLAEVDIFIVKITVRLYGRVC